MKKEKDDLWREGGRRGGVERREGRLIGEE